MTFKPTFDFRAYRVRGLTIKTSSDEFFQFTAVVTPIRDPEKQERIEFVTDYGGQGQRFSRFLRSLRLGWCDKFDEMAIDRVFAMKNGGATPDDFASLEVASQCLQSDREAYRRAQEYAADCKAEELGLAA